MLIDGALLDMVVKDCQPFSIVEDVGFKKFVSLLDPNYILPSRKALKTMVATKFEDEKEKAKEELKKATAVDLTSDMWTSIHMDAYLAVTCHFVDSKDKLESFLLTVVKFPVSHSCEPSSSKTCHHGRMGHSVQAWLLMVQQILLHV